MGGGGRALPHTGGGGGNGRCAAPGESVDITFDASVGRTCIYDILVVTEDGSRTRKNRENLCTTTTEYYSED